MSKNKFSASIYFTDQADDRRFLFQIINIGHETDDLKFIFNSPQSSTSVIYSDSDRKYPDESLIRSYGEISYHHDGAVLFKLPQTKRDPGTIYNNPHGTGFRRTPLDQIMVWEPLIQGKIVRYQTCRREDSDDIIDIPKNTIIFNGDPFEYIIFLGNLICANPPNNSPNEMLFRLNDVATNIDLILWIYKSDYTGEPLRINDVVVGWNDNNVIQVVERNL